MHTDMGEKIVTVTRDILAAVLDKSDTDEQADANLERVRTLLYRRKIIDRRRAAAEQQYRRDVEDCDQRLKELQEQCDHLVTSHIVGWTGGPGSHDPHTVCLVCGGRVELSTPRKS